MRREKPKLTSLWYALDEASFGSERTLNLRESLPTAAEARARTEIWLRARQMTRAEEVLVITGRGNQSIGGIGVIRQEILGMLPSLRRRGIVKSWKEHSPGSVVIHLASMKTLFDAPRRRRGNADDEKATGKFKSIAGIDAETSRLLRQLALHNLESLGVPQSDHFLEQEMMRTFSALTNAVANTGDREQAIREAILKALDESLD